MSERKEKLLSRLEQICDDLGIELYEWQNDPHLAGGGYNALIDHALDSIEQHVAEHDAGTVHVKVAPEVDTEELDQYIGEALRKALYAVIPQLLTEALSNHPLIQGDTHYHFPEPPIDAIPWNGFPPPDPYQKFD